MHNNGMENEKNQMGQLTNCKVAPVKHPNPTRGEPHYHPTGPLGEKTA
jgi:hypothetical protein